MLREEWESASRARIGGEGGERDRSCWESLVKRERERGGEGEEGWTVCWCP